MCEYSDSYIEGKRFIWYNFVIENCIKYKKSFSKTGGTTFEI